MISANDFDKKFEALVSQRICFSQKKPPLWGANQASQNLQPTTVVVLVSSQMMT